MNWTRSGLTSMRSEPWTVGKVTVRGAVSYELWHDKQPGMVGHFSTFQAAMREAERIQLGLGSLTAGGE